MWRMHDGDRVLTEAEWAVFVVGLDLLRDFVEEDIVSQSDDTDTGVPPFDRLSAEQKLALLADLACAVRDPAVPMPRHTAANEGTLMAVMLTFLDMLKEEFDADEPGQTDLRERLLRAAADTDRPARLPRLKTRKWEAWVGLHECLLSRILWDYDFAMGDDFLDLPPELAQMKLASMGIAADYYLDTPAEPSEKGLIAARQRLARLLGHIVPDDNGLYPTLEDLFHGLFVGPVSTEQVAAYEDHPWVQVTGTSDHGGWDCGYDRWRAMFAAAVPTTPFAIRPAVDGPAPDLPEGVRADQSDTGWVVRLADGSCWCGLTENMWTSAPYQEVPALAFRSEAEARVAYTQSAAMYAERAARQEQAFARLGQQG